MQIGTRWPFGDQPPVALPAAVLDALQQVEGQDACGSKTWTLTWLEGRPIVESDAGTRVSETAEGEVRIQSIQDAQGTYPAPLSELEDDDDWLS